MYPHATYQGKAVVEHSANGLLLMLPDGSVSCCTNARQAYSTARQWFREHVPTGAIGVGKIEWRDGIVPPSEGD